MAGLEPATSTFVGLRAIQLRHILEIRLGGKTEKPAAKWRGLRVSEEVVWNLQTTVEISPCQGMRAIPIATATVAAEDGDRGEEGHGVHGRRSNWRRLERTYRSSVKFVKGCLKVFFGFLARNGGNYRKNNYKCALTSRRAADYDFPSCPSRRRYPMFSHLLEGGQMFNLSAYLSHARRPASAPKSGSYRSTSTPNLVSVSRKSPHPRF